jgi:hypothetical protein
MQDERYGKGNREEKGFLGGDLGVDDKNRRLLWFRRKLLRIIPFA